MMTMPNGSPLKHASNLTVRRCTTSARSKLYELIVQFRHDAAELEDPKANALFEFSAEILAGMARSFRSLDEEPLETDDHP